MLAAILHSRLTTDGTSGDKKSPGSRSAAATSSYARRGSGDSVKSSIMFYWLCLLAGSSALCYLCHPTLRFRVAGDHSLPLSFSLRSLDIGEVNGHGGNCWQQERTSSVDLDSTKPPGCPPERSEFDFTSRDEAFFAFSSSSGVSSFWWCGRS